MENIVTRKCPFCCEDIHADAIKCRYCMSKIPLPVDESKKEQDSKKTKGSGCGCLLAGFLFLLVNAVCYFVMKYLDSLPK
jgi:hypothetical protein